MFSVAELVRQWNNAYYRTVLKNASWEGIEKVFQGELSEDQVKASEAQASEQAQANVTRAARVLEVAYPDMKSEWRELLSVIM